MPIYEYQCDNCEHKLERLQKLNDDLLLTCPECDEDSLRKLVSATSFRLKGTGWYETDFKDKPKKKDKDKEKDAPAKKKDDSKSSGKSETKSSNSSSSDKKGASSSA